jgi:hypothetical protein
LTPESVLGDFDDGKFTQFGITSRFYRRDGRYFVEIEGSDGKLAEFEVRYAVGVAPLQQYLVALEGGRLQALGLAWDVPGQALVPPLSTRRSRPTTRVTAASLAWS